MQIKETSISGCYELLPIKREDSRGYFVKTFNSEYFAKNDLEADFQESYYTVSHRNVLRGLHFQTPPADHAKLIYCVFGKVVDVALDLRLGSPSYLKSTSIELDSEKANVVYLAKGLAHGFYVLSEQATLVYKVGSVYSPENDSGLLWNSAGIDWQLSGQPILSERDQSFIALSDFKTPFKFEG